MRSISMPAAQPPGIGKPVAPDGPWHRLVDRIARVIEQSSDRTESPAAAVEREIECEIRDPRLLDGLELRLDATRYRRVLLHGDPQQRFSVLALIWPPGAASPVHLHHVWCALGVHSGDLVEEHFARCGTPVTELPPRLGERRLQPGACSHDSELGRQAHRIRNDTRALAISVHVYGVAGDRVEDGVNALLFP